MTTSKLVPDLSKLNYSDLAQHLLEVDFSDCLFSKNLDFIRARLCSTIQDAIKLYAPLVKLKPKSISNSTVRHQLNCVRSLRRSYRRNASPVFKAKLDKSEVALLDAMTAAKSSYEAHLVHQFAFNSNYKIFKYIKTILKTNPLPPILHLAEKSASNDHEKASLFNGFFESVYSKPTGSTSTGLDSTPSHTLDIITISESEVPCQILIHLKHQALMVSVRKFSVFVLLHYFK